MNLKPTENEIRDLVENYENQSLPDSEADRLVRLLETNREARSIYIEHMKMSAFMRQEARSRNLLSPASPSSGRVRHIPRRLIYIPAMAAVASLAVIATVFFMIAAKDQPATFRASHGASFNHQSKGGDRVRGDTFHKNDSIEILEGILEISLPDDVTAVLTAPSLVRFEDDGLLYLDHGSAWIVVGKKGHGFQVETPGIVATDLGTRFGVIVPATGSTDAEEVHVEKGKVNVVSKRFPGKTEALKTSQSVRLMPDGRLARIPSGTADFRKSFEAGILAQYTFDVPGGSSAYTATTTAPGTTSSDITNAPGHTLGGTPRGLFDIYSSSGNNPDGSGIVTAGIASAGTSSGDLLNFRADRGQTRSEAVAASGGIPSSREYFSFSVTGLGSNTLDLETLSFDMRKGATWNDRGVVVWYSTDNFATAGNTFRLGQGSANTALLPDGTKDRLARNVSFSLAPLPDTTSSIAFRFMTTNLPGTTVQFDNITISGVVVP